jgi:ribosomal protein L13
MGRLATNIATTLMGKHKPIYDPAGKKTMPLMNYLQLI